MGLGRGQVPLVRASERVAGQLWSGFEILLLEGQWEMGETGETRETGEDVDLFRRRMPALNGTELKFSNSPRSIREELLRRNWWGDRLADDRIRKTQ